VRKAQACTAARAGSEGSAAIKAPVVVCTVCTHVMMQRKALVVVLAVIDGVSIECSMQQGQRHTSALIREENDCTYERGERAAGGGNQLQLRHRVTGLKEAAHAYVSMCMRLCFK
jgi:hypothetical protein